MTALNLPNDIINKIFSYIEGKHNQIIKNGLTNTFWTNRELSTFDIKFAFYMIRCNLLRDKKTSNHKVIKYNKYFKYSVLAFLANKTNKLRVPIHPNKNNKKRFCILFIYII